MTNTTALTIGSSALLDAEDPYQSDDDYQRFLGEAAKHCHCDNDICDSVLAGGLCEGRINSDLDDDDEPQREAGRWEQ